MSFPKTYSNLLITLFERRSGKEPRDYNGYFGDIYIKPYTRVGTYIVGVLAAYVLSEHRVTLQRLIFSSNRNITQLTGWMLSLGTIFAILYGQSDIYTGQRLDDVWAEAVYNALARIAWGVAIGWLVIAAAFNRSGLVGSFLSWPLWSVVARVSYSAYLLHPLVFLFYAQTSRRPFHMTDITVIFMFGGSVCTILLLSTLYTLGLESPVISLLK